MRLNTENRLMPLLETISCRVADLWGLENLGRSGCWWVIVRVGWSISWWCFWMEVANGFAGWLKLGDSLPSFWRNAILCFITYDLRVQSAIDPFTQPFPPYLALIVEFNFLYATSPIELFSRFRCLILTFFLRSTDFHFWSSTPTQLFSYFWLAIYAMILLHRIFSLVAGIIEHSASSTHQLLF